MRPRARSPRDLFVRGSAARFLGRRFPCRIGRSGAATQKREGDGGTPVGAHRAELVLYRPDRIPPPETCLPVRPLRLADGWSDDPRDPEYNRLVRRPHGFRHEALWLSGRVYDLIVVLDWNRRPTVAGEGSAVFLHVMDPLGRPTAGCVSLAPGDLVHVLRHWRPDSRVIVDRARPVARTGSVHTFSEM